MSADAWYPRDDEYWFDPDTAGAQPLRMGDLVRVGIDGWLGALVIHPTCEIPKGRTQTIQVVRVSRIADVQDRSQQQRIVVGFEIKDGLPRPAFAQTMYLAPTQVNKYDEAMYGDFNDVAVVGKDEVDHVAAMTHGCRVHLIRRKLYYRYRWLVDVDAVRSWEAVRIGNDASFPDPRPDWAPALT